MLTLFRGGPAMWLSDERRGSGSGSPTTTGSRSTTATAPSPAGPSSPTGSRTGSALFYHSQDRHVNVPVSEITGHRGGTDNSLTRITIKPTHLIGGYAQLSWGFNYYGPDRPPARPADHRPQAQGARCEYQMKVRAQMGMVMNLDKCIGCHTCSVTCKNVWTNRRGHRVRLVQQRRDQARTRLPASTTRTRRGGTAAGSSTARAGCKLKAGGPLKKLANIFWNPDLPELDDYYDPWTYDYDKLISAPAGDRQPVARPKSQVTGERPRPAVGPELGRRPRRLGRARRLRPQPRGTSRRRSSSSSSRPS